MPELPANDEPIDVLQRDVDRDRADSPPAEKTEYTLQDLATEFALFTPALLMTHGWFDRDPLVEFNAAHPCDVPELLPCAIDSQLRFFSGLGKTTMNGQIVDWDHRLYMIAKPRWDDCREFIAAIAAYNVPQQHYFKLGHHQLQIVDPFRLRSGAVLDSLPTVEITVFAVSSNRQFVYLHPATDPPRTRPYPQVCDPREDLLLEAAAVLGPPPDPAHLSEIIGKRARP